MVWKRKRVGEGRPAATIQGPVVGVRSWLVGCVHKEIPKSTLREVREVVGYAWDPHSRASAYLPTARGANTADVWMEILRNELIEPFLFATNGNLTKYARWNPPTHWTTARCRYYDRHHAPVHDCTCGLYTYHPDRGRNMLMMRDDLIVACGQVSGVIVADGRVETHWDGFRASRMKPVCLFGSKRDKVSSLLAARLGLDFQPIPDKDKKSSESVLETAGLYGSMVPAELRPSKPPRNSLAMYNSALKQMYSSGAMQAQWNRQTYGGYQAIVPIRTSSSAHAQWVSQSGATIPPPDQTMAQRWAQASLEQQKQELRKLQEAHAREIRNYAKQYRKPGSPG